MSGVDDETEQQSTAHPELDAQVRSRFKFHQHKKVS